jgi:hypothetical protein
VHITSCTHCIFELVRQHSATKDDEPVIRQDLDSPAMLDMLAELCPHSPLQLGVCWRWESSRPDLSSYATEAFSYRVMVEVVVALDYAPVLAHWFDHSVSRHPAPASWAENQHQAGAKAGAKPRAQD